MIDLGPYSIYLALTAAIVGTFFYPTYKNTKAKYILFIVWYSVLTDLVGFHIFSKLKIPGYLIYNLYKLVSITFYLWWFGSLLKSAKRKATIRYFIYAFLLANIIELLMLEYFFYQSTVYVFVIGVIFLVITICYYFIETFNSEEVLKLRNSSYFWFSLGVLLFHAVFIPFYVTSKFFTTDNKSIVPLGLAVFILNFIMNGCFIIGFIKAKHSAKRHLLNGRNYEA